MTGRRFAGGRRNRTGKSGGVVAVAGETPTTIPGLKAWFDSRTDDYFTFSTGAQISAWTSRAGSIGSVAWIQATSSAQPTRALSVATLGSKNAVLFDGTDDYLDTNNANAWKFLHDGTGASRFLVIRADSTGGTTQRFGQTANTSSDSGVLWQFNTTSMSLQVHKGDGTTVNTWSLSTGAHWARDVSRWQLWGYVSGMQHSRVSGSSVTNADTASPPSSANPTRTLRMGATATPINWIKGYVAQDLFYDHVLTAGETTQLATWANQQYGVSV